MRIVFTLNTIGFGGAEVFAVRLANALATRHQIYLYVHNYGFGGTELISQLDPKVRIVYFHKNRFIDFLSWKANALFSLFKINFRERVKLNWFKKFVERERIDLISSQGIVTDYLLPGLKIKVPIVSTIHEDYEFMFLRNPDILMPRLDFFSRKIDHFIYLADSSKDFLIKHFGVSSDRFTKIYNGFPYGYQATKKEDTSKFTFGMIARGSPDKGWREALLAFKIVQEKSKRPVELILIGGEDYFDSLKPDFSDLPVTFIRSTLDPLSYIQKFDAGILPSYVECLPNFIVECFSQGKPVIATNVGEISNMIATPNGVSGLLTDLVSGKPDVDTFAAQMLAYVSNQDLYNQHAFHTKFTFARFDMTLCTDQYLLCFENQIALMR